MYKFGESTRLVSNLRIDIIRITVKAVSQPLEEWQGTTVRETANHLTVSVLCCQLICAGLTNMVIGSELGNNHETGKSVSIFLLVQCCIKPNVIC